MRLLIIWLFIVASCLSHCTDSNAMTIVESPKSYSDRVDFSVRDQIKEYVCREIECPEHLKLDEFKTSGRQIASIHITVHYQF